MFTCNIGSEQIVLSTSFVMGGWRFCGRETCICHTVHACVFMRDGHSCVFLLVFFFAVSKATLEKVQRDRVKSIGLSQVCRCHL